MKSLKVALIGALSAAALLSPAADAGEPQKPAYYYYSRGEKVPLTIALDQVGVLAHQDVSEAQFKAAFARRGLSLLHSFPNKLFILRLERPTDLPALVTLPREIREQEPGLVLQAGLVTTLPGRDAPMIVTDRLIVQLRRSAHRRQLEGLARRLGAEVLMENPFTKNQFFLRTTGASRLDALQISNRLHERQDLVEYAHPDFIKVVISRAVLNDPLLPRQWHHDNTGQGGGTPGADARTSRAWKEITVGAETTLLAVIDDGFDPTHPDLLPNLWFNPKETANGTDDADLFEFADDIHGWNFMGCAAGMTGSCGNNDLTGNPHGTAVAGVAAAQGGNGLGVSGSCPNCSMMLLIRGLLDSAMGMAFGYAEQMGADVINNSWGYLLGTGPSESVTDAIAQAATAGRGGRGAVVVFSMDNEQVNECAGISQDISSLEHVIAVSRSTNWDRFDLGGFGDCMDLLAPSAGTFTVNPILGEPHGTMFITTTDVSGPPGYNNLAPPEGCPTEVEPALVPQNDYTSCFFGTSAAAPQVAGIAGLVLTVNPDLQRVQLQRLLQDTADKIEDSAGHYGDDNGKSRPPLTASTHGWGRVNAFEAVRVAARTPGGKAGVDVFLRDNRLDWGNTDNPSSTLLEATRGTIAHWESQDIKVDSPANGYWPTPSAAGFQAFVDEPPSVAPGAVNRVYVRVRNRGPATAAAVSVKLHWARLDPGPSHVPPPLPPGFWTAFPSDPGDTSRWHPLRCAATPTSSVCQIVDLKYSGASVAGTTEDRARIVRFDFPAPPPDTTLSDRITLLAMVDSPQDLIAAESRGTLIVDTITPRDNNVSHRNVTLSTIPVTQQKK